MNLDMIKEKIEKMAENLSACSEEELRAALQEASQCDALVSDDAWVGKWIGAVQEELKNRGANSSTSVVLRNNASTGSNGNLYIKAVLQWALSPISSGYAHTGDCINLGCEYVWYDLYVYDANSSALLTKKTGIYGDSAWQLVNDGNGFKIIK